MWTGQVGEGGPGAGQAKATVAKGLEAGPGPLLTFLRLKV